MLLGLICCVPLGTKRGRPKGSENKTATAASPVVAKRAFSDEARANIVAAQKKRWAAAKKESVK